MHSVPRELSSLCEYTTQRRQLSYTLRPCTIITEDKWAIQIVFLSVSWVGWCLGAGCYDRGRNSLRIPHALPSLAKATARGSGSRFGAPFRSTDSPHTHALHRPEHGATGLHPGTTAMCISLFCSLTHIPPPRSLVHHWKDFSSKLHATGAT